ncbi:MAG: phosphate signaling complex protein PhoU [Phycisphaerae bacterium]|nr:phosphate signaling complex protein PhoU [Phycisphaerae bacterium]
MTIHPRQFDKELGDLKSKLLMMAAAAAKMTDQVITALVERDESIAKDVPNDEQDVNRMQLEIDEIVLALLATYQPVASDLRFLMACTRITGELERIGDLAINISQNTRTLLQHPPVKPLIDIPKMASTARDMLDKAMQALVKSDPLLAQTVIMMDDIVDRLCDQVKDHLLTIMKQNSDTIVERALALILIARHLERIADHATNIAEDVIYMCQGKDVRHPGISRER